MRIATWNVNSLRVRLPQLMAWLQSSPVDVLAMQETKLADPEFPHGDFTALGYHSLYAGQKTYNGVALLTRSPATDALTDIPGLGDAHRRVLAATCAGVRVINVYVPNGQSVGSEKYAYKLRWLDALADWLRAELRSAARLVVLGDFNIAPEDRDVHDPAAWAGSVHVSEPERAKLRTLLALGLVDVFRRFEQPPRTFTWWDYRMLAFRRNHGLRIDLVLANDTLARECTAVVVDREPRRAERPSDHAPVIADFTPSP
ncbi:MAG: exodeoxyribonuclease III [Gammaproteobacteria bacterium]|nr:exodeoxyribonuclease III [Gammaproteobacteria bacterium]